MMQKLIASFLMINFLACTAIEKNKIAFQGISSSTAPASLTSYNCSYFGQFDTLTACYTTTFANCDFQWQTFPGGGFGVCYLPVAGWQACATTPTAWTYSVYSNWCNTGTTDALLNKIYKQARSVIGCTSTVCACLTPQTISRNCTATVDCGVVDPSFNPAALPTPAPCP